MNRNSGTVSPPALEISQVTKRYDDVIAVQDVSVTAKREVVGLVGANGAGKTTLLKAILGLVNLDTGEIRVCGHHIRHDPVEAKKKIGYLPEDLRLYDRLTGWEFLSFIAGLKRVNGSDELESGLDEFGLHDKRHVLIEDYSLGMKKKIGLLAALMGSPPLILLDEPLNGLDAVSMRQLRLRLERLAESGSTILISSHVMGFIERICRRVLVLKSGRIVIEGSPASLREESGMVNESFEDVFLHFAL